MSHQWMFHDTTTVCVDRSSRNPVVAVITIIIMIIIIILVVILQPSIRFRFIVMDHGRMGDNVLDDVDDDDDYQEFHVTTAIPSFCYFEYFIYI